MFLVSDLNDVLAVSVLTVLAAAVLAWKRAWSWLLALALTVPGGMLVNVLMKLAFHRARPSLEHPLLVLKTYSFPSRHVAGATLFYGFLVARYVGRPGPWGRKVMAMAAAVVLIALLALSRMYLGVHYLSDVLAAFAEASAWLTLCGVATRTWSRYRAGTRGLGALGSGWPSSKAMVKAGASNRTPAMAGSGRIDAVEVGHRQRRDGRRDRDLANRLASVLSRKYLHSWGCMRG
jgi:membrane-associated phospholipid phosphatase